MLRFRYFLSVMDKEQITV